MMTPRWDRFVWNPGAPSRVLIHVRLARLWLVAVLVAGSFACGTAGGDKSATSLDEVSMTDDDCPVTIPEKTTFEPSQPEGAVYTENFPEPDPYPSQYPGDDSVWYGSEGLWTVLSLDGLYERKTVFWSANFPGGTVEERPDLHVTWTRLDSKEAVVFDNDGMATSGHTPDVGWFMITGTEERLPAGCWQVEATYKGATLSYVYDKD